MTTTKVSICNVALGLIGDRTISSFEEGSTHAQRCRDFYDQTRRAVLRDHPWSCAKKRTVLAPTSTHPSFGFAHSFPLPRDFLRIIDAGCEEFDIESRHILANTNKINLVYIADNDNEETWDSMLVDAMSLKLASRLAKPNTGSDASGQSALAEYERLIKRARAINAQERPSQDMQYEQSSYLQGRY